MTVTKDILNAGLAAQAASLALSNLSKKKKLKTSNVVRQGFNNIIGTAMIKEQADFIGTM